MNILRKIPNINNIILVNIASDAELIKIPKRYKYGNIKKQIRLYLETRKNRVINIFMPYINNKNYSIIKNKLFNMDWKYDYYYFSAISNIYMPCLTNIKYTQKHYIFENFEKNCPLLINFINKCTFDKANLIDKFKEITINEANLYNEIRIELEKKIHIKFKQNPKMGKTMWVLLFNNHTKLGKNHIDMQRNLFGRLFRCIICIYDNSDYTFKVGDNVYKLKTGDAIILPSEVFHQTLPMTYGHRAVLIIDYFTTNIVNLNKLLLFNIFNNIKKLNINV
jgi:hypothetical protein